MSIFKIHNKESAESELSALFDSTEEKIDFVPNIFAVIAESVPALKTYTAMSNYFEQSSFTDIEKETIQIVTSIENKCGYCVAGHSAFAVVKQVPSPIIKSLRENLPIEEPRIEALANFVRSLIRSKGRVDQKDLILFFDAGFSKAQMMEVVIGISLKYLTNFISNATSLPLDSAFEPFAWTEVQEQQNTHALKTRAI